MEQENSLNTLLNSAGTNQQQRFMQALEASYIKLDERSRKDLLQYVYELAEVIKYFDLSNIESGNWQTFLNAFHNSGSLPKLSTLNKQIDTKTDLEPLLALLFAFFEMFSCAQDSINQLTEKHLDYYYRQVLQLTEKPAVADEVHFIFELAKNVKTHLIQAGTQIKTSAVNDEEFPIIYEIPEQKILSKARAVDFRSVRIDTVEVEEDSLTPAPPPVPPLRSGNLGTTPNSQRNPGTDLSQSSGVRFSVKDMQGNPNISILGTRSLRANQPSGDIIRRSTFLSAPVAKSKDGLGEELDEEEASWFPFGQSRNNNPAAMQDGRIGFAIADPVLRMKEGERTINFKVNLAFTNFRGNASTVLINGLRSYYTGEEGWVEISPYVDGSVSQELITQVDSMTGRTIEAKFLEINIPLRVEAPAIVDYDEEIHLEQIATNWPVFKFEIENPVALTRNEDGDINTSGIDNNAFDLLKSHTVESIEVSVEVNGVKDLILQSDQAILDPGKPFMPFGATPKFGSSFYFGSEEVFQKALHSLTLNWEWESPPDDLLAYYSGYGIPTSQPDRPDFISSLSILKAGSWLNGVQDDGMGTLSTDFEIFTAGSEAHQLTFESTAQRSNSTDPQLPEGAVNVAPDITIDQNFNQKSKNGFGRLTLTGPRFTPDPTAFEYGFEAFGHKNFPGVFADAAIQIATAGVPFNGSMPNPPYTPVFRTFSLNYIAKSTIQANNQSRYGQFFQLEPFGHAEVIPQKVSGFVLPQYSSYGNFFIGLSEMEPQKNLHLLFQVAEGSSLDSTGLLQGEVAWFYLSKTNDWKALEGVDIISNETRELQKSGIISFAMPKDAAADQKRMPSGMHWLKAELQPEAAQDFPELFPDRASQLIDVHAQAIRAKLVIPEGSDVAYDTHLSTSLAAESVDSLLVKDAAVKAITQPYTSFGGRPMEKSTTFNTRISERLRHRGRALSSWDYERLTLEAFPDVYKVRCLNHIDAEDLTAEAIACRSCNKPPAPAPCHTTVVVVSNLRNKNAVNPLEPSSSVVQLQEIQEYLKAQAPLFTELDVINPLYERIQADFKVKFREGFDEGFYLDALNTELVKYLSPWAFEEGKDIEFGGKIYRSDIIAFVESRVYVDYVSDLRLYQFIDTESDVPNSLGGICYMKIGEDFIVRETNLSETDGNIPSYIENPYSGKGLEIAKASSPNSILVSHPSHRIESVGSGSDTSSCNDDVFLGIGSMVVRSTFLVSTQA